VSVSVSDLDPVRDAQLERQQPGFTHKRGEGRHDSEDRRSEADDRAGSSKHRKRSKEHGDHKDHKDHKRHKEHKRHRGDDGGSGGRTAVTWVRENIRVRIVDKHLRGGALYNKKAAVVDVSAADAFSLRLEESGRLVEGVRSASVETVLPKAGGGVMLVLGPHRLKRGRLVQRDTASARATVQLAGDFEVVECGFDEVAEWVGGAIDEELM
jgi:G patch domain/KOW motif-containing protein